MFDSSITAREVITDVINEADIAPDITYESYVKWLTATEHLIYTEIIKEKGEYVIDSNINELNNIITIDLDDINVPENEDNVRFEEIYAIYVGSTQLILANLASGYIFTNSYFKSKDNLCIHLERPLGDREIKIIYLVKPKKKEITEVDGEKVLPEDTIKLPYEFVDLIKAKLRGEAYKVANEDSLAAKWLNDYNVLLENFKVWIDRERLGL